VLAGQKPDRQNFGDGVYFRNSGPCISSQVVFPDNSMPAVQESFDALKAIMDG